MVAQLSIEVFLSFRELKLETQRLTLFQPNRLITKQFMVHAHALYADHSRT